MSRIYLVRHGQASFGSDSYDRLSPLGERQSVLLGQHLRRIGFHAETWLSGSLARQRSTLTALLQGMEAASATDFHEGFNEYDHEAILGAYLPRVMADRGLTPQELSPLLGDNRLFQAVFVQVMRHWIEGTPHERPPFETWKAFQARIHASLERLARSGQERIVVVSSGGPISLAVQAALDLSLEKTLALNWSIYNASVTELRVRQGALALAGFNNVTHLQLAGEEGLLTYR
ncbi:histidine phosphatase family protein [Stigmatella sp. ncwal1]|uniref:Histidine phosphatase family protein n=1 Tax=Stigmatella ashevillensis TaxID=2995309 RepID=A0ABT5D3E3_9BACT|nr:histidine phosphatase family protein [Stigmatella ashevillena]MDC0708194.1 histidine phosphatase family protein [Stigmatella ashevillena]